MYATINGTCLMAIAIVLPQGDESNVIGFPYGSPWWIMAMVWHGILWWCCTALKVTPQRGWLAASLPAPVQLLSLGGALLALHSSTAFETRSLAAILALGWSAFVSLLVCHFRKTPTTAQSAFSAVDFAGLTNVTALLFLPMTGFLPLF